MNSATIQDVLMGPIGRILGLMFLVSVFSIGLGTVNGLYLQTEAACVLNHERFDRVAPMDSADKTADNRWELVKTTSAAGAANPTVGTTATILEIRGTGANATCQASTTATSSLTAVSAYTPLGTEVLITADGIIEGGNWAPASGIFSGLMGGVIGIILQACGLAGPVMLLVQLGSFARSFMHSTGMHPLLGVVLMLLVLLLVATLLNVFVPFLEGAVFAIDPNRFLMYDTGLGQLSIVVRSFYGVVLVAGVLMVIWELWSQVNSGNMLTAQRM